MNLKQNKKGFLMSQHANTETKEKQVSDELAQHESYFVNLVAKQFSAYEGRYHEKHKKLWS
uniref:Uncharacterized protein n=1 Tax=Helianthus annuus TaxID=4232 RepID=A0A251UQH4_HELAN